MSIQALKNAQRHLRSGLKYRKLAGEDGAEPTIQDTIAEFCEQHVAMNLLTMQNPNYRSARIKVEREGVLLPVFEAAKVNMTRANKRTGRKAPGVKTEEANLIWMSINPYDFPEFTKYLENNQYMFIRSVEVIFRSNSAANNAPILCRYIGPENADMDEWMYDRPFETLYDYALNSMCQEEAIGIKEGHMVLRSPIYMEGFSTGKATVSLNGAKMGVISCKQRPPTKINYGLILFESKSVDPQTILIQLFFEMDFYSTVNKEAFEDSGYAKGARTN